MAREEERTPCAGPIGALGISSETGLDLGKERRTTTRAPPAEMFTAVANSSDSLPFSSRLRTKTGIARRSRAHLRCYFLGEFVRNIVAVQNKDKPITVPQIGGQTSDHPEERWNPAKPRYHYGNYRRYPLSTKFGIHRLRLLKSETFFA